MLEKVKMLKDNNGVGTVKKFTPPQPPKSCLHGGVEMSFRGDEKKFRRASRAISTPKTNITSPYKFFLDQLLLPPMNLEVKSNAFDRQKKW